MSTVLIAGSRDITSKFLIERAIRESGFNVEKIIEGGASGVDTLARDWAKKNGVEYETVEADWQGHPERHITKNGHTYDPLAGHDRNIKMADEAEAGIFIWNGYSKGTKHCFEYMQKLGKPVRILRSVPQDRGEDR